MAEKLKALCTIFGILVKYDDVKDIKKIQEILKYTVRTGHGKRIVYNTAEFYKIYEIENVKYLSIPPCTYETNYKNIQKYLNLQITDKRPSGDKIPEEKFKSDNSFELQPNQQAAFDYIMENHLNKNAVKKLKSCFTFIMDTGLGKSFLTAKIIEEKRRKAMIVVMNTGQVKQYKTDVFDKYYPNLTLGVYGDKQKKDGDVVLVVINSLDKITPTMMKKFGIIIFDEVTEYCSEKRRELLWKTQCRYTLGLTATPDERSDKMDIVYKQLVGPLLYAKEIPNFNVEEIKWKGTVHKLCYYGPDEYTQKLCSKTGELSYLLMNEQFACDPYRTQMILDWIIKLYKQNMNIFVFALKRDHVEGLAECVRKSGMLCELDFEDEQDSNKTESEFKVLMGGATDDDLKTAKSNSRIIFTTYGYSSVGLSIIKMDAMIFVSSRKAKARQIIGRILRRGGDPSIERQIVDVSDQKTSIKNHFSERAKVYDEKGFPIIKYNIPYEDIIVSEHVKEFMKTTKNVNINSDLSF